MRVLLTNDDGYLAEGIQALSEALAEDCEVYVAAPLLQQSGASHSMNTHRPVSVQAVEVPQARQAWAIDGTPVDCVKIGLERLVPENVDCVVSGINHGTNLGTDVFYSGTVGAAAEAAILGVPALAVSLDSIGKETADFKAAAQLARQVVRRLYEEVQPPHMLFNLNIPGLPLKQIRGFRAARLGARRYLNHLEQQTVQSEKMEFLLNGSCEELSHRPNDDVVLLKAGYATLTPLSLERTALEEMPLCRRITGEAE